MLKSAGDKHKFWSFFQVLFFQSVHSFKISMQPFNLISAKRCINNYCNYAAYA
ncbi:MAG: hypothetical protein H6Q15_2461 [Bacteroidetes bacterium]|nr:hypothetical protein [Bacteroidota bacterium]